MKVQTKIELDGAQPGEVVDIDDETRAKQLLSQGFVVPAPVYEDEGEGPEDFIEYEDRPSESEDESEDDAGENTFERDDY